MRDGTHRLEVDIYDEDDNLIRVTYVTYHRGYPQSETSPAEPAYIEVCMAEDENGDEVEDMDEINFNHRDEIEKAWNREFPGSRV